MSTVRKITVNVPSEVLDDAIRVTGKGITETVVEGLLELKRREKRSSLRRLRGRVQFDFDVETRR